MGISSKDYALLIVLNANPFMSMTELAKRLDIPKGKANKLFHRLKNQGIIQNPVAIYKPEPLGLYRINVLTKIPSIECMKIVENACDEHPYTHYRSRAYGEFFCLFIQFDIPVNSIQHVNEFFSELQKLGYVTQFEIYESTGIREELFPDLSRYNELTSTWEFSWEEWFSITLKEPVILPLPLKINNDFSQFQLFHFRLLRKLTSNALLKPKALEKEFELKKADARKHYNFVVNNYISRIRFLYDREVFDLSEYFIGIGTQLTMKEQATLYNRIKEYPPPFHLAIDILKHGNVLLWSNMSPSQASHFAYSFWENIPNFKIKTLSTKQKSSALYWFYPPNFDFEEKQWIKTKEYMVKDPIERLNKRIEIIMKE